MCSHSSNHFSFRNVYSMLYVNNVQSLKFANNIIQSVNTCLIEDKYCKYVIQQTSYRGIMTLLILSAEMHVI